MALKLFDRVRMTITAGGTGDVTLGAAVQDAAKGYFQSLAEAGAANGDEFPYVIEQGSTFEFGRGTYIAGAPGFSRTLIKSSTGSLLNVTAAAQMFVGALVDPLFNLLLRSDLASQALAGGFTSSIVNDGTKSSGTYALTPAGGNFRKATANGAFSIAAPTVAGCYNMTVDLSNGASAGVISFTGFISGYPKGDAYTTGNGQKFKLHVSKTDVGVTGMLEALQ